MHELVSHKTEQAKQIHNRISQRKPPYYNGLVFENHVLEAELGSRDEGGRAVGRPTESEVKLRLEP